MESTMKNIDALLRQRILPIYSHAETEYNKKIITICYHAGLRFFEFTNRRDNALEEFTALKAYCKAALPDMQLGVGTIKNVSDAQKFLSAGAAFLVSPLISMELIAFAKEKNMLWIPGCATASEVGMAENAGIQLVKIFPAKQLGGPAYINALKGPYPKMQLMATGNIAADAAEIKSYFDAGSVVVGLGSALFSASVMEQANPEKAVTTLRELYKELAGG
jgi:2-dehydro-3-deoxyphosphogluconate aldolase / (4S)-4-hydroxy-2-oxoglutarate aldolase